MWQDKTIYHTCSFAHDRLKATPKFDLNYLRNLAYVGDEEVFFSGSDGSRQSIFDYDPFSIPLLDTADEYEQLPPIMSYPSF